MGSNAIKVWIFSGLFPATAYNCSPHRRIVSLLVGLMKSILSNMVKISLSSHTSFLCSLHLKRALWSITIRSESKDLKFILCVLIKPSDSSTFYWSTAYSQGCCWPTRTFLFVKQFKPCNVSSMSGKDSR